MSTGGEGGMISTNDKKLWLKLWSTKDHGKNYKSVFFKNHKTYLLTLIRYFTTTAIKSL